MYFESAYSRSVHNDYWAGKGGGVIWFFPDVIVRVDVITT